MILDFDIKDNELQFVLQRMPDRIRVAMASALNREMMHLVALVKSAYLSGDPLHVKTGTLRRSVTYRVDSSITAITGVAGTNVPYAKVHEFGLTVVQQVRAHTRATGLSTANAKFHATRMGLKGFSKKEKVNQLKRSASFGAQRVSAFTREISYPKRAFMAPAFAFSQPFIIASLTAALAEAMAMRGGAQ